MTPVIPGELRACPGPHGVGAPPQDGTVASTTLSLQPKALTSALPVVLPTALPVAPRACWDRRGSAWGAQRVTGARASSVCDGGGGVTTLCPTKGLLSPVRGPRPWSTFGLHAAWVPWGLGLGLQGPEVEGTFGDAVPGQRGEVGRSPGDAGPRTRLDADAPCLGPPGCGRPGHGRWTSLHVTQVRRPRPPVATWLPPWTPAAEAGEGWRGGQRGHPSAPSPEVITGDYRACK